MSNTSGWSLTARLISKHFGVLGDKLSETIANFDPETATEADRDRLQSTLRETAQKLAAARASFNKEHQDVVNLQNLIANAIKFTHQGGIYIRMETAPSAQDNHLNVKIRVRDTGVGIPAS